MNPNRRLFVTAAVTAALLAMLSATAGAAAPAVGGRGTTTIRLDGRAARGLLAHGVRVRALRPAIATRAGIALPVSAGTVTTGATLDHEGALRLRSGEGRRARTLTLTGLRVTLGARSAISALIGGERRVLFGVASTAKTRRIDAVAGTVSLPAATVTLTRAGASLIGAKLRLPRLVGGRMGTLRIDAAVRLAPATPAPVAGGDPATGPATAGETPGAPTPVPVGPPPLARPQTAVDITAATITWHVRDSFIQYISAGLGTAASGGATAAPPATAPGSDAPLVYEFHFPFRHGWYDPVGGALSVSYSGTVTFRYPAHRINLGAKDPEIEINGAASRAVFTTSSSDGVGRGVLVNLDPGGAAPVSVSADGKTRTYEQLPGTIPSEAGASVFAGYYLPGDPFGWISVSLSVA